MDWLVGFAALCAGNEHTTLLSQACTSLCCRRVTTRGRGRTARKRQLISVAVRSNSGEAESDSAGDEESNDESSEFQWKETWKFSVLEERLRAVQEAEVRRDRIRASNWRSGRMRQQIVAIIDDDFVRKIKFVDNILVHGSCSGDLFVTDMNSQQPIAKICGLTGTVTALDFDGHLVVAGSADCNILVGSVGLGRHLLLRGHTDTVTETILLGPVMKSVHSVLASASLDGTVRIWNSYSGEEVGILKLDDPILCMSVEHGYMFLGCKSGKVYVYALYRMARLFEFLCHPAGNITSVRYNHESEKLLAACADGTMHLFCFETSKLLRTVYAHADTVMDCQFDSSKIVTASRDGTVAVWDPSTGESLYRIHGYTMYITTVQIDGDRMVADGTNNVVTAHTFVPEEERP